MTDSWPHREWEWWPTADLIESERHGDQAEAEVGHSKVGDEHVPGEEYGKDDDDIDNNSG